MAYAKGKAYPILIQMSQKLPEAKKLFDDLGKISQQDFESRFGALLKSNPKYDKSSPEDDIGREAPSFKDDLNTKIQTLSKMNASSSRAEEMEWRGVVKEVTQKLAVDDEFGWQDYLATKYDSFEKYKKKSNLGGNKDLQLLAKGFYQPPQKVSMDEFYQLASDKDAVVYFRGIKPQYNRERMFAEKGFDESGAIIEHFDYTTADIQYNTFTDKIPYYMGGGQNGDGIYITSNVYEALEYTNGDRNDDVLRFTAKKSDLNVIKKWQLDYLAENVAESIYRMGKELQVEVTTLEMNLKNLSEEQVKDYKIKEKKLQGYYITRKMILESDSSALAIMLGYDAIAVNRSGLEYPAEHLVVLNYGKFKSFDNEEIRNKDQPEKYWKFDSNLDRNDQFFTTRMD
jgi:predicted nucleic acid-binding protein